MRSHRRYSVMFLLYRSQFYSSTGRSCGEKSEVLQYCICTSRFNENEGKRMEWANYLAKGVQTPVFHMCDAKEFALATAGGGFYYSPTFKDDKFIHATADPQFLLEAGNHFYKAVVGDWICIKVEPSLLGGPIVYEAPAPVGNIEAFDYVKAPAFPHIYGGIPGKAVLATHRIIRGGDGSFLSIEGLC